VENKNEISIQRENSIRNASENNSCSSTFKVEPLSMPKNPKRSKVNSSNNQNIYEAINSSQMNIHNRIHSKQKRFACDQCQKTCSHKCSLTIHKRLQTGEKCTQSNN
jgi:hypothetical protein